MSALHLLLLLSCTPALIIRPFHQQAISASGSVGSLFKFREPLRVHQGLTLWTLCPALQLPILSLCSNIVKCSCFLFVGAEQPRLLAISVNEHSHVCCLLPPSSIRERIIDNLKCFINCYWSKLPNRTIEIGHALCDASQSWAGQRFPPSVLHNTGCSLKRYGWLATHISGCEQ